MIFFVCVKPEKQSQSGFQLDVGDSALQIVGLGATLLRVSVFSTSVQIESAAPDDSPFHTKLDDVLTAFTASTTRTLLAPSDDFSFFVQFRQSRDCRFDAVFTTSHVFFAVHPLPLHYFLFDLESKLEEYTEQECLESRCVRQLMKDRVDHSFVEVDGVDAVVKIEVLNSSDRLALDAWAHKDVHS